MQVQRQESHSDWLRSPRGDGVSISTIPEAIKKLTIMDTDRKWQPRSLLLIITKSALMTMMVFLLTMKYSIIRTESVM